MHCQSGLTLVEMLVGVALMLLLLGLAMPAWDRLATYNGLVADSNRTIGLIRLARSEAVGEGPVLVCASNSDCRRFDDGSPGLKAVLDHNNNRRHDAGEPVIAEIRLQPDTRLYWRSFRNRPYLRLDPRGTVYHQNGHFALCRGRQGHKVVVSWLGSLRAERQNAAEAAALCERG